MGLVNTQTCLWKQVFIVMVIGFLCYAIAAPAFGQTDLKADIIFALDTSASMGNNVEAFENGFVTGFAIPLEGADIDAHIVLLASD